MVLQQWWKKAMRWRVKNIEAHGSYSHPTVDPLNKTGAFPVFACFLHPPEPLFLNWAVAVTGTSILHHHGRLVLGRLFQR